MERSIQDAAELIKNAKSCIVLSGAGISVESGIPDFRSAGGLWAKYDPAVYAFIGTFQSNPEKVWGMIFEMIDLAVNAKPNNGHIALARLEQMGYIDAVITQNIDNLHQEAGSKNVIEYHGNAKKLECMKCGTKYPLDDFNLAKKEIPRCKKCNRILKPSIVFFGEMIPQEALFQSEKYASVADLVLVVGTSAIVYPAAAIPLTAKNNGAKIIEFNLESTELTSHATDLFIQGSAGMSLCSIIA